MSSDDEPAWILDRDEGLVALRVWAYPDGRGHLYAGDLDGEVEVELDQVEVEELVVALAQGSAGDVAIPERFDAEPSGDGRVDLMEYDEGVWKIMKRMSREESVELGLALLRAAKEPR